jgi:hypothetical protein
MFRRGASCAGVAVELQPVGARHRASAAGQGPRHGEVTRPRRPAAISDGVRVPFTKPATAASSLAALAKAVNDV